MATIHAFTERGLGVAPFRLIRVETTSDRAAANSERRANGLTYTENLCGGSCDYCGTAIWEVYKIRSADGKEFKVGCECVKKTGDKGLIDLVKREHSKIQTAARHEKERSKIAAYRQLIDDNAAALVEIPHPNEYRAAAGDTMLDYANWMFANAGNAGKLKIGRTVEKLLNS